MNSSAVISLFICHEDTKIKSIFQISMSQAESPDLEPSADLSSPPAGPIQQGPDSSQDVPAMSASPESLICHESSGDMSTVDTCTGETAEATSQSEIKTPAELQVIECDQPVSLDPENAEHAEVCNMRW